ncbi:Imidazolonepropionase [Saccharopolyspora shandongensis]|uniref:Imidazolonepropionase n=1 Tax=Saccharopolyspora shandongensis TaxID=418495 RepID=A0A1H3T450_9PSEU|nr:amidohydrolase family protein [Saccharopolyspora shandongensis]SDZ44505.1 Imidazolonepropionase [Saccharopolyspora shandongensis]
MNSRIVFRNATVLDPRAGELLPDRSVVVADGRIVEVTDEPVRAAEEIDVRGRVLMPGLIDSHVHATQASADFAELKSWSPYYAAARAGQVLDQMLMRGFTTVRDMGGADHGVARAVAEGLFRGPRVLFGGPIIAPTGGHGLTRICDGEVELRRAIREQMALGAHHIKLTVSGGVVSSMRIDALGYSEPEIRAAVDEANLAHRYVAGHAYTAEAVNRALRCGVRTIEHGNLMDESSVELFQQHQAFYVPTLATYHALTRDDAPRALPAENRRKLHDVIDAGLHALELADRAGLKIGYGTDLHGELHSYQLAEFSLRAQVQRPAEIVRAATITGAEIAGMVGQIGEIVPGAVADLLVVDGNPLEDIGVLTDPERRLLLIMQGGELVRNDVTSVR